MMQEIEAVLQRVREFAEKENAGYTAEEVSLRAEARRLHQVGKLNALEDRFIMTQCVFSVEMRSQEGHEREVTVFLAEDDKLWTQRTKTTAFGSTTAVYPD